MNIELPINLKQQSIAIPLKPDQQQFSSLLIYTKGYC